MIRIALLAVGILVASCAHSGGPIPAPPGGGVAVDPETSLSFYLQARGFYARLSQRRVNTLETFSDPLLREQFHTENQFFDYYADLAQSLYDAHFEKSRPIAVAVQGFLFEDSDQVRVQVLFLGQDKRPLRPNGTSLVRVDRWERADGRWWLTPEKL